MHDLDSNKLEHVKPSSNAPKQLFNQAHQRNRDQRRENIARHKLK